MYAKIVGFTVLALVTAAPVMAKESIIVRNKSSKTVHYVYATDDDVDQYGWGEDALCDSCVIYPGDTHTFFIPTSWQCLIDIKAVAADGSKWERFDLDVCDSRYWNLLD